MGYYVNITATDIKIPESLYPKICKHLLTSDFLTKASNMSGGCYGAEGKKKAWFSWVDMTDLEKHLKNDDLPAVLEEFGFGVMFKPDTGDIVDLSYDNKTGDEQILFKYIAQVLPGKHTITWSGEEGSLWQWQISDFQFRIVDGVVLFPKPRSKKGKTK